jgi:hypothetical protein
MKHAKPKVKKISTKITITLQFAGGEKQNAKTGKTFFDFHAQGGYVQ